MTEHTQNKSRVLCAGIAVEDLVMRVENFPHPGTKVSASEFLFTGGGCAANASVTLARLGARTAFAGPLGGRKDEFSQRVVNGLQAEGIDCGGVVRVDDAAASVSLILLDARGEKTIATRRGKGLDSALPAEPEKLAANADAVLVDNRFTEFVTPICAAARKRNIPVVIDLDRATAPNDPLLKLGTHVIASSEALHGTVPGADLTAALKKLAAALPGFVAFTDGPNGVTWLDGGRLRHLPAFKIAAIDTLGAGDAFHGAFTFALLEGRDIEAAMRFASATAAIKCTRFGGLTGAPTRAEVEDFLAKN